MTNSIQIGCALINKGGKALQCSQSCRRAAAARRLLSMTRVGKERRHNKHLVAVSSFTNVANTQRVYELTVK